MGVVLSPGQSHESTMLEPLLNEVSVAGEADRSLSRFSIVSGDKGYDGLKARAAINERGSTPLIPHRKRRDGSPGGDGEEFDRLLYKRRNVVERLIGRLKEHRRIATRYDKLAESFRAFIILGCVRIWTEDLL